jgi:hypothetical protein
MFLSNNNNAFFIKKDELVSLSFKEVLENREYNINAFEKLFEGVDISIDLPIIDFL